MGYITGTSIGLGFGVVLGYFGLHYILYNQSVPTSDPTIEQICKEACTDDYCNDCKRRFP